MNYSEAVYDSRTESFVLPVDRHSWDWLAGFARRLGLSVEVADHQAEPLLGEAVPEGDAVRQLIRGEPVAFKSGLREALGGTGTAFAVIDGQAVGFLSLSTRPRYVLVVARPATQIADQQRQVQAIGASLAAAVEAQLNKSTAGDAVLERLPALQRVLARAANGGREREVVRAFAEALAIWEDIEVRGYVENLEGLFVLDIVLPGSVPSEAAAVLDREVDGDGAGILRLTAADADRLGFAGGTDVLICRIGPRWQLALSGRIARNAEARLSTYGMLVADAVERASNVAVSRATWSMLEVLVASGGEFEPAANRVLELLKAELKASALALSVTVPGKGHVLAAGDTASFERLDGTDRNRCLRFGSAVGSHHRMTLAAIREVDAFHRPEQRILEAVGRLLVAWLPQVLARTTHAHDRRSRSLAAAEVIERHGRAVVQSGDTVTLVLVSDAAAVFQPDRIRQCVTAIRGQLRPGDVAAAIDEDEIAVLLPSTNIESAAIVIDRLQHEVMAPFGARWHVGVAARESGTGEGSLIEAARRNAMYRAGVTNS